MDWSSWMPYYLAIQRDLRIDPASDVGSARMLSRLLKGNVNVMHAEDSRLCASRTISGKDVYIFGAGPDLEMELDRLITERTDAGKWSYGSSGEDILIAADGATSVLMSRGLTPHVIVTDLDGGVDDQISCLTKGSVMFLLAHGDNVPMVQAVAPRLTGSVVGTMQAEPGTVDDLDNYGGFSDGDRAAFIAQHYGCRSMTLLGFNFNEVADKLTEGGGRAVMSEEEKARKFKKLAWASLLLGLITEPKVKFYSQKMIWI